MLTMTELIGFGVGASGPNPTATATGGTITFAGGYTIHTFTGSGTLQCRATIKMRALRQSG